MIPESFILPESVAQTLAAVARSEALRKAEYLRAGDFDGYMGLTNEQNRLSSFLKIEPRLTAPAFWRMLAEVWMLSETISARQRTWLRLFESKRANRELLMTKAERTKLAALPDRLTIWCGCGHAAGRRGMSWTLREKIARQFAEYACGTRRRCLAPNLAGTQPTIVKATCFKSNVLAYFSGRKEAEIVIDPKNTFSIEIKP